MTEDMNRCIEACLSCYRACLSTEMNHCLVHLCSLTDSRIANSPEFLTIGSNRPVYRNN